MYQGFYLLCTLQGNSGLQLNYSKICFIFKAIPEPNLNGVFWHISGNCWGCITIQVRLEIQWEQHAEISSSVPNPSGRHFQLRDTSPISSFLVYFGDQINSYYPEERAYRLWKWKWSPRGPSQSKPSLLQTEIWNVIWKLSLPLRQKAYISWKEILFSLWKQVTDGSTFTQMCLFNEIFTHSKVYFPLSAKHSSSRAEPKHSELSCKQLWLCQGAYINEIPVFQ